MGQELVDIHGTFSVIAGRATRHNVFLNIANSVIDPVDPHLGHIFQATVMTRRCAERYPVLLGQGKVQFSPLGIRFP
jgi:hypothetical protein